MRTGSTVLCGARRSVTWAIALIGGFYLFTLVLGFGAAAMVGPEVIENAPGGVNSAAPLLAFALGGEIFLGIISAVAFATILAVVAGLAITASASFAHDIYNGVIKHGQAPEQGRRADGVMGDGDGDVDQGLGLVARGQRVDGRGHGQPGEALLVGGPARGVRVQVHEPDQPYVGVRGQGA